MDVAGEQSNKKKLISNAYTKLFRHGTLPQQSGHRIESIVTISTWIVDESHYVVLVMYAVYTFCGEKSFFKATCTYPVLACSASEPPNNLDVE